MEKKQLSEWGQEAVGKRLPTAGWELTYSDGGLLPGVRHGCLEQKLKLGCTSVWLCSREGWLAYIHNTHCRAHGNS